MSDGDLPPSATVTYEFRDASVPPPFHRSFVLVFDRSRGLGTRQAAAVSRSRRTGLPVVTLGTVITTEDVRALDDDA